MATRFEREARQPSPGKKTSRRTAPTLPEQVARFYGLGLEVLARACGIPLEALSDWPKHANAVSRKKIQRILSLLDRLTGVMRKRFIATWLQNPNPAAKDLSPLQLLEQGKYDHVEEMIYRFEAGEPF
jgi:hypothetical protein